MFETALIDEIKLDNTLLSYLSVYRTTPAIFAEFAPEDAEFPYLVLEIRSSGEQEFTGIESFTIMFDFYDRSKSRAACREAANRTKNRLDMKKLDSDRYDNIRLSYFSGSPVPADDPMDIHYNLQFSARAGRKEWMQTLP